MEFLCDHFDISWQDAKNKSALVDRLVRRLLDAPPTASSSTDGGIPSSGAPSPRGAASSEDMEIFVKLPNGSTITLNVTFRTTVADLLYAIEQMYDIPEAGSFLTFGGQRLNGWRTLVDLRIRAGSTLQLVRSGEEENKEEEENYEAPEEEGENVEEEAQDEPEESEELIEAVSACFFISFFSQTKETKETNNIHHVRGRWGVLANLREDAWRDDHHDEFVQL